MNPGAAMSLSGRAVALLTLVILSVPAVAQDNLVVNSGFDMNVSGWQQGTWSGEWRSFDADGSNASGSLFLTNDTGGSFTDHAWTQCFPVMPGTMVEVGAMTFSPTGQGSDDEPIVVLISFESDDCTTGKRLSTFSNKNQQPGEWHLQNAQGTAGFGIGSYQLMLVPPRDGELVLSAYFDNVYYREVGQEFVLNPSMSTSWYDPDQSGHGIQLQIYSGTNAWMCWYTFDNMGVPVWLCGIGVITNNLIRFLDVFIVEGGQFPPDFDPDMITTETWGQIFIEIDSCDTGHMEWTTDDPRFQDGEMPLVRLLPLWGVKCEW